MWKNQGSKNNMLARSGARLLAQSTRSLGGRALTLSPFSVARVACGTVSARYLSSSASRKNGESNEASSEGGEQYPFFHRLNYILSEPIEPTQSTLINQIRDNQIVHLPLVINAGNKWAPIEGGLTLPRRDKYDTGANTFSAYEVAEYLYRPFVFPSAPTLRGSTKSSPPSSKRARAPSAPSSSSIRVHEP